MLLVYLVTCLPTQLSLRYTEASKGENECMQTVITTDSSQATENLAENLGKRLRGGEVIELVSDLGGGKTTFVRGLARGMGSQDIVRSPSFTLANQYQSKNLTLYHFDFYRLDDPGVVRHELTEALADPRSVVAVEWAEVVKQALVHPYISVIMEPTTEHARRLTFTYPERYSYLFPLKD